MKYEAHGIASAGSVVAVGGDVSLACMLSCMHPHTHYTTFIQDNKVYLYAWDGKELKAGDVLEGPKGVVHALAFSPDGKLLAAGDVRGFVFPPPTCLFGTILNCSFYLVRWKDRSL